MLAPLVWIAAPGFARASVVISSARLWPAQEYTRLIIEAAQPIEHQARMLRNPLRLVIDLRNVELSPELANIGAHVAPGDPYIQSIRVARFTPDAVRIVLDLKVDVDPQMFALKPIDVHGHRVVLDLYPLVPPDPLMALVQGDREPPAPDPAQSTMNDPPLTAPPPRDTRDLGSR